MNQFPDARARVAGLGLAACLAVVAPVVLAQGAFPNKPIHILLGVPPGGNLDINTRAVAEQMAGSLGQSVVVENRPSASALVATQAVAKAAADGYTLLSMSNTFVTVPATVKAPGYDALRNFTAIGMFARVPLSLSVAANSPYRTVADLLAAARAKPNQISSGTGGDGSAGDIATNILSIQADVRFLKVPYKGGSAPALIDLMGGRLDLVFDPVSTSAQHVKGGRMRSLAVTTSARSGLLPDVPSLAEAGVKDYRYEVFNGLIAPAGTPREVVARLYEALAKGLGAGSLRKLYLDTGVEVPEGENPARFQAFIEGEIGRYLKMAKDGYLKTE